MSVMAVNVDGAYVDLPDPAYQGYQAIWKELTKSDRNTLGNLIKERITTKFTVDVEWHGLNAAQKNLLISATNGNTFSVRFVSMMDDAVAFGTFYRGDDLDIKGYGLFKDNKFQFYDVTMSFVEV